MQVLELPLPAVQCEIRDDDKGCADLCADDLGPAEVPLHRLEARICSLAAKLASSTCEWLRLVAEFDRRKGWAQWGIKSCAHWLS